MGADSHPARSRSMNLICPTADSLFAVQLDNLAKAHGVRAFAVHPGGIMTDLQRHLSREEMIASGWIDQEGPVDGRFKTLEQGAATSVWAATSPQLAGIGGVYCDVADVTTQRAQTRVSGALTLTQLTRSGRAALGVVR